MIASIMLFLFLVGCLAAVAAWLVERGLRGVGLPARWVWLGAMGVGPVLLALGAFAPARAGTRSLGTLPTAVIDLPALVVGAGGGVAAFFAALAAPLWWASAVLFVGALFRARWLLARQARWWSPEQVQGRSVMVSNALGPAVAGTLRPRIVLPRWALSLPEPELGLILTHEEEHLRAGDARLLGFALVLITATAWNPLSWWMLRRLRSAVEIDCDARVLRRGGDARTYGESLLTVAARASRPSLALAAFSESPLSLERRLIAMTERISPRSRATGALLIAGGLLLGAQACGVDSPMSQQSARGDGPTSSEIPVALREPTFTPFTVAPEITNRAAVIAAMEANYPRLLRDAGVGGTVRVYFLIAADGAVAEVRVDQSSGHPALDQAALAVAGVYRFRPALNGDEPVPVWVSFPITFQVR